MALNIKNAEVERLAAEVAEITGESKTVAILNSLRERRHKLLSPGERRERLEAVTKWLSEEVWPKVPKHIRDNGLSKTQQEEILGYGPHGYCE